MALLPLVNAYGAMIGPYHDGSLSVNKESYPIPGEGTVNIELDGKEEIFSSVKDDPGAIAILCAGTFMILVGIVKSIRALLKPLDNREERKHAERRREGEE